MLPRLLWSILFIGLVGLLPTHAFQSGSKSNSERPGENRRLGRRSKYQTTRRRRTRPQYWRCQSGNFRSALGIESCIEPAVRGKGSGKVVDYAKKQSAVKRGNWAIEQLDDLKARDLSSERSSELLMLDHALTKLAQEDEVKATIVECHFFIGLTMAEVADLLGLSKRKVERDWNFTRAWLKREMTEE